MSYLLEYRATERERQRTADLLKLVPKHRTSVLDIGARDGHFSRLLTAHFSKVVALDLEPPPFTIPGVETTAGDVTHLQFPDRSFDCLFCAEVLEHVSQLQLACREIVRVARYEVVIGVPYRQDTRLGRLTCRACGKVSPPWGHVNEFDVGKLQSLFRGWKLEKVSFVGVNPTRTNAFSAKLMDWAGNPWGSYDQEEPCIHCGAKLTPPAERSIPARLCSAAAVRLTRLQSHFVKPEANWLHAVFSRQE